MFEGTEGPLAGAKRDEPGIVVWAKVSAEGERQQSISARHVAIRDEHFGYIDLPAHKCP